MSEPNGSPSSALRPIARDGEDGKGTDHDEKYMKDLYCVTLPSNGYV